VFYDGAVRQGSDITTQMARIGKTAGLTTFEKCDAFGDNYVLIEQSGRNISLGYCHYGMVANGTHSGYCDCSTPAPGCAIYWPGVAPWYSYDWDDPLYGLESNSWLHFGVGGWSWNGIKSDGRLYGGGYNAYGMLGIGTGDQTCKYPLATLCDTDVTGWALCEVGQITGVGIDTNGQLWIWGLEDGSGSLGLGDPDLYHYQGSPTQIGTATNWIDAEVSEYNGAALNSSGELWAWGSGYRGSMAHLPGTLGCDDSGSYWCEHWFPVKISGDHFFIAFSQGWYHTLAIDEDNNVWACGMDDTGCLGLGNELEDDYYSWQQIPNLKASYVDAGYSTSIAIALDGSVWAWGALGNYDLYSPTQLKFGNYWED